MGIAYRLTAFDRRTEELIGSYAVPAYLVPKLRKIANIPALDDGAGDFPLNAMQVKNLAKALGITVHPEANDYFIEPYLVDLDSEARSAAKQ